MYSEIETLKTRIINNIILVTLFILLPPFFSTIFRWTLTGWLTVNIIHTSIYFALIYIALFRNKIKLYTKIYILVVFFAVLGLTALWFFGFNGLYYYAILSIVFISIYTERKIAITFIGILSVLYVTVGIYYITGVKEATVELNSFTRSIWQWFTIIFSLVAFSVIIIVGFGELYRELVKNIEEKIVIKNEREKYILELEVMKEKLDEKVEELNELNSSKDKFFSIIANDLISPFTSILGFSQLLYDNFEEFDNKKRKAFLSLLHNGILNTYELLEDILLWARMQRNLIDCNASKEDLLVLTNKIVDILRISAEKKSVDISVQIPNEMYAIADGFMISTVLRNLISNSIKFSVSGKGKIVISAKKITDNSNNEMVEICVRDNGVGISNDIKGIIFNVGENRSNPGTENEKGTGLGLPICYDFVKKHKGQIWVESEEGKGSAFFFTIPAEK